MSASAYRVADVRFRYPGAAAPALRDVTLEVAAGTHAAIVGPNGAGKSTLLRVLLGILRPERGTVRFDGRDLAAWDRRELARRVGVVSQEAAPDLPLTVREFVEMGRNPWLRPWKGPGPRDRRAVETALERTELAALAERALSAVSGGELQRAKLARALAQEPGTLLLDEPTAHLDLGHEMRMFETLAELLDEGITALTVTHNLHLASRYADMVILLAEGVVLAAGDPASVLRAEPLERAFDWPVEVVDLGPKGRHVVPGPGAARRRGSGSRQAGMAERDFTREESGG